MKRHPVIKWGLRSLLFLLLTGGLVIIWVNHQFAKIRGSLTEVIDTKGLYNSYEGIIITNVQLLAPDCTHFVPDQHVVLKEGIIAAIHQDSIFEEGLSVIDGEGKYLIPGLVDSHVHLRSSKNDLYLYLANGVTTIREMTGNLSHLAWKAEIARGALGPRMFVASEKVNSKSGVAAYFEEWTRTRINYATEEAAAEKIRKLKEQGFDAIKIGSFINKKMYEATIKYAHQNDLPAIGHIPYSVGIDSFYHKGQDEVAHIEELTKGVIWKYGGYHAEKAEDFLQYLREQSEEIAIQLHQNNTPVTSTLFLMESLPNQKLDYETLIKEVPIEYINTGILEGSPITPGWLPGQNYYEEAIEVKNDPIKRKNSRIFWETYAKALHIMIEALHKYEVPILAGTDTNIPIMVPGFSFHDELLSLSRTSLTNTEVLYAATAAPAIWAKTNTGMIKIGYKADLLLLNQNPLEDIQHSRSIEAVFVDKHWINKMQVKQILESVKKVNEASREKDISIYQK